MSNPIPWASFRHPLQNPTEKCYANASRQAEKLVQNIYSRCFYDHGLTMLHLGGAYKCMIEVYQAQSHSIHDLLLCQNHIVRSVKLSLFHPALNSCARSTPRTYKAFQFETSIQFQQRYGNEIAEMSPSQSRTCSQNQLQNRKKQLLPLSRCKTKLSEDLIREVFEI